MELLSIAKMNLRNKYFLKDKIKLILSALSIILLFIIILGVYQSLIYPFAIKKELFVIKNTNSSAKINNLNIDCKKLFFIFNTNSKRELSLLFLYKNNNNISESFIKKISIDSSRDTLFEFPIEKLDSFNEIIIYPEDALDNDEIISVIIRVDVVGTRQAGKIRNYLEGLRP